MKRILFILLQFFLCFSHAAAKDKTEVAARKAAKELLKEGWSLYDPSGPELYRQILDQRKKSAVSSKWDANRKAYIMSTQRARSKHLEDAYEMAQEDCYTCIASLLKTEIEEVMTHNAIATHQTGGTPNEEELHRIIGSKSEGHIQDLEKGMIIYRKMKDQDQYEVQVTVSLCTDQLFDTCQVPFECQKE